MSAVAISGMIGVIFRQWAYDDPFITYRYAANLAHGLGFVYNTGDRTLSTTTPLFTLLLAAVALFYPNLPLAANLLGAASLGAGALALWDLAQTYQTPWAGWGALLLYPTFGMVLGTLGSETPIYLACCLWAFAAYARGRYRWVAICAALALLLRNDGVLVAVVLGLDYAIEIWRARRPMPWQPVSLYLALTLPWFIFAAAYFGSPVPVTLAVKQLQGQMLISQRFAPGLLTILRGYTGWNYLIAAGLALAGGIWASVSARGWWRLWAWTIVYFLAYSILGVSRYFWYYAPLVPGGIAAVGLGLEAVWRALARRPWAEHWRVGLALAGLLGLAFFQGRDAWNLAQGGDTRYGIYRAVGEWLRAQTPPQATVGTLEVGIIGYYAERPMVDFAGLIQPAVAKQFSPQATYQDSARWAMQAYHPAYVVLNPEWFPALMNADVRPHCETVQVFAGEPYGYTGRLEVERCAWP